MKYGISAAALIIQHNKVLLVNHKQAGAYDFWVPPGGRLEGTESIFDCARRETFEETGLTVELSDILYIQEFWEPGYHFCKFFIMCAAFSGCLSIENKVQSEVFLVDAQLFAENELHDMTVYPPVLKDQFWDDIVAEYPVMHYLGLERLRH